MTAPESPLPAPGLSQLQREAATWFARMRGPDAEASKAEFDAWLASSAQHLSAYNRAAEVWNLGKFLAEPAMPIAGPAAAGPAIGRKRSTVMALAACAVCIMLLGGWLAISRLGYVARDAPPTIADGGRSLPGHPVRITTLARQNRTVRLSDGSLVSLRAGARLAVSFDKALRGLRLERGSARFEVAHESRPFIVTAGSGTVTARGTIFDVSVAGDNHVLVKLLRGSVDVAMPAPSQSSRPSARMVTRLVPGERIEFADAGLSAQPQPASRAGAGSATLDLDHARLADLLATANHDAAVQISLGDPSLGELEISGVMRTNDPFKLADHLAAVLDLKIEHPVPSRIVLQRR
jgi:transmembrane sensor